MNISNYISTQAIAESIARDSEYELTYFDDIQEWCYECVRLINSPTVFIPKLHIAQLEDFRFRLPEDFYMMQGVRSYYSKIPLNLSTDIYYQSTYSTTKEPYPLAGDDGNPLPTATFYIDNDGRPVVPQGYLFPSMVDQSYEVLTTANQTSVGNDYTYKLEDGWLYSSLQDKWLEMVYLSFPIDEYGFPLIPDDQSYINAVKFYVIERLDYRAWRKGKIADKVYQKSEQERAYYIAQAANKSKMPQTLDEWENLKNQWCRLIQHPNQHDSGFRYLDRPETLQFSNRRANYQTYSRPY